MHIVQIAHTNANWPNWRHILRNEFVFYGTFNGSFFSFEFRPLILLWTRISGYSLLLNFLVTVFFMTKLTSSFNNFEKKNYGAIKHFLKLRKTVARKAHEKFVKVVKTTHTYTWNIVIHTTNMLEAYHKHTYTQTHAVSIHVGAFITQTIRVYEAFSILCTTYVH